MNGIEALGRPFHRHIEESVVAPLRADLDVYVAALEEAVATMAGIAAEAPPAGAAPEAGADPSPERRSGDADGPAGTGAAGEARVIADRRLRYATRFHGRFGTDLFDEATEARAAFFTHLTATLEPGTEPARAVRLRNEDDAPPAPDLVRPRPWQRLGARVRRAEDREVPVSRLEAVYRTELARRLEPVANAAARLASVAVAEIRWELHERTELEHDEAGLAPNLGAAADEVVSRLETVAKEVQEEYDQALRAAVIRVPEEDGDAHHREETRRADLLASWTGFERTLMSNVAAEALLARALAAMEAAVAETARELEAVRTHRGEEPLERLAEGVEELGDRAERELDRGAEALESLADDADRLFAAELPRVRALLPRLEEHTERLKESLAAIPGIVPEDLQISEHPVPVIPERPRKLQLRDAPLEALLNTACGGTLRRSVDRSMSDARQELEAMTQELERIHHAVAFQLRAPLRGGFDDAETRTLVEGITSRTAAQLEDLRTRGLTPIDHVVDGLEDRVRDEADTLRSAVANREFLRIHSEIAEEQAVHQLTTGVERAREAAGAAARGAGAAVGAGRRVVTAVRDWAQRQLGVGRVEREEMLESLEQSLLGQDQRVVGLPAIYRQLFDVEADVPWDELLVPRDEELAVIRRAYDRWVEDRSATVAVVGEKGSGKTTLLRLAAQRIFEETRVVRATPGRSIDDPDELLRRLGQAFGLDGPAGSDGATDLATRINAQAPAVAVVEDLHHLFIRALGGFDALETFLELVSATRSNVLWVVTVDEFAWRYLSRVVGLEAHFVHKVSTTDLSPDELEAAIMARHDVSGFSLRFETEAPDPEGGRWARLLGRPTGELTRKEAQRRRYFRELAEIAEGNIVLALFYWLRSIKEVDGHVLALGDPQIIELEFLERLPLAQLHSIAAIILHGGLSEAAHRRVFQLPAVESRLLLASLADAHMVFLSSDGEYKINKVLYRPFIRLLVSRNIF